MKKKDNMNKESQIGPEDEKEQIYIKCNYISIIKNC